MSDEQIEKMEEYFEDEKINKWLNPKVLAIIIIVIVVITLLILVPLYYQSQKDLNFLYSIMFLLWLGGLSG